MAGALFAGLAGGLGLLGNYMMQDAVDQRKRERDLNDYKARAEFANTLQERLMQRKMELAQQYPTYKHFVTNPIDGSVTGFTPFGQASQLKSGDPEQRELAMNMKQAQIDQQKQRAALADSQMGLNAARMGQANAAAELARVKAAGGGFAPKGGTGKQPSPTQVLAAAKELAKQYDPEAYAPLSKIDAIDPDAVNTRAKRQAAAMAKAQADLASGKAKMPSAGGLLSSGQYGSFGDLVPSGSESSDDDQDEEEQQDNEDLMNY